MDKRFFTPQELGQFAQNEPERLLEAALMQVDQLQQRANQLKEIRAQLKARDARIAELEAQWDGAQRASFRQAAPFRIAEEKRATAPQPPGRKAGHPGAFRPRPEHIDEDIAVELSACPHCGQEHWLNQHQIEQLIEDLPAMRPHVTRLRTYQATCAGCGQTSASRHPRQVSAATGAAAVHLGPRALAIAADLNKAKGLPMRKTCAVLQDHFGLRLTPGGLSQALDRVAAKVEAQYVQLGAKLIEAPVLHVDETSWWVAGSLHWLWVFTHENGTFYRVDQSRGRTVLQSVIGPQFPGVLVSDCLSTYDLENGAQHKCYAHHFKAIRHASQIHPEQGQGFLTGIGTLLKRALALGQEKAAAPQKSILDQIEQLQREAETLLATPREQSGEESVRRRISKQRDHPFTFLRHDGVDATNNLAERQLRPAVITRKISCGNKTQASAHTFEVLCSLAATCTQIGSSFVELVAKAVPFHSG